jgi:hypothetical protein
MKKVIFSLLMTLALASISLGATKGKIFHGEIMDLQCAKMGSHDFMAKRFGLKPGAECARGCVKMGGKYALYDKATKTTYQLDDQEKPEAFAGEEVKVTGRYDKATKTIHVVDIQAAK